MVLYMDDSDTCVRAYLTQPYQKKESLIAGVSEEIPVFLLFHMLPPTQQRWPVIEKEAYAIMYALQKLHYYLDRAEFMIKTNHRPLKYLFVAD